tara:strand:+ start:614 stop:883 length:270 start_codon:yes stop_codon:yes gene_type:complete
MRIYCVGYNAVLCNYNVASGKDPFSSDREEGVSDLDGVLDVLGELQQDRERKRFQVRIGSDVPADKIDGFRDSLTDRFPNAEVRLGFDD